METEVKRLVYHHTPIQQIHSPLLEHHGVELLIKREDQNHLSVSGNKWWKLKYNLEEAVRQGHKTVLTFGGAYSNHIYATAAAAAEIGLHSIGIIRGDEILPRNPTLEFAHQQGMILHFVSREDYKNKISPAFVNRLNETFGEFYSIPEGGTNDLAVKGCSEFAQTLAPISFDYLCLPVGTGGTMAGIVAGLSGRNIIGFSVLKDGAFLSKEVADLAPDRATTKWQINLDYHFGGYAKTTPALINFIRTFEQQYGIPLDQVYTGKMMYGIFDLMEKGFFKKGATILVLHTGGLQGRSSLLD